MPLQKTKPKTLHYILFYKPYGVLSQFTDAEGRPTLKDFGPFPASAYSVGRLDADSEGLLLLTNDNTLKKYLTEPKYEHPRTYLVQIENIPSELSLQKLCDGVVIEGKKTKPAEARLLAEEPHLPPRPVPIRFRKNVPTAWIELTLREGRNRQVRKMTAAIGHPTLRLVRSKIGFLTLEGLNPGKHRLLTKEEVKHLLAKTI
ncbi:MAG: pseudouridine synthase [Ignavibacteriales bacterium]|nr:pseudouridine synthase [Ignavibacteriales bacterium]